MSLNAPYGTWGAPYLRPRCFEHPEREAIGICVVCRRPLCAECSTPIDGINRCAPCLEGLRSQGRFRGVVGHDETSELRVTNLLGLAFFGGLVFLLMLGLTYCVQ